MVQSHSGCSNNHRNYTIKNPMSSTSGKRRGSSGRGSALKSHAPPTTPRSKDKFSFSNAGPFVTEGGAKLTSGRSLNNASPKVSLVKSGGNRAMIASNALPDNPTSNSTTVSEMSSVAEQFNSYRFDEASALRTYKKMMTLHMKDDMFRKLKFITNDAMLEFTTNKHSLCGYVCTEMRVSTDQWGEYWELVKKTTKKMIENQRTNATSAVKKGYRGTYNTN
jgi:hypothetical protein